MPEHKGKGVLVAFEGIDGAGKTTQLQALADVLTAAGQSVVTSKEPTNGPWGRRIRESAVTGRMSLADELEAFIHDRAEHAQQLVEPALRSGSIVLLDRYYYSTMAYQGARGADIGEIRRMMESRFTIPDAVILLDVPPSLAVHRISHGRGEAPNDFERESGLEVARSIFNSIAGSDSRVIRIDGSASVEEVHRRVVEEFVGGPFKARRCAKAYGCDDPTHCSFRFSGECEWWKQSSSIQPAAALMA